jgi:hypothetical protein
MMTVGKRLKISKETSEDIKGDIRRYQRRHQKISKETSEDIKGDIRRYQRRHQKPFIE